MEIVNLEFAHPRAEHQQSQWDIQIPARRERGAGRDAGRFADGDRAGGPSA